jgi:hypothetical protein
MCYNLRYQASGGDISDETKIKISKSSIKMWSDPIIKEKYYQHNLLLVKISIILKTLKKQIIKVGLMKEKPNKVN